MKIELDRLVQIREPVLVYAIKGDNQAIIEELEEKKVIYADDGIYIWMCLSDTGLIQQNKFQFQFNYPDKLNGFQ